MFIKRTDLALEARELWQESAERTTRLMGVKATKRKLEGYPVTRVDILDHRGEEALGKPQGSYFTIDPVSYTHLDVYKRQTYRCTAGPR